MGFQERPVDIKYPAVREVLQGKKIAPTARKYGVHRDSLREWTKRAKKVIKEVLEPDKRGPKFKEPRVDPNLKKIEKLNELLERREVQIKELEGLLERYQERGKEKEPRPKECKRCGCQKIYKNGTYPVKQKRFFDILRAREEKEIIIQQFICACCGEPVHLEEESAFFWWASRQRA